MSGYVLVVALGPVQEFIAQARRTRDLWFGSHLLSEVSKAAAHAITKEKGELVFPAITDQSELAPCDGPRLQGKTAFNVPNKIVALLPAGAEPKIAAVSARQAAMARWHGFANQVWGKCQEIVEGSARKAWEEQIDTFLEFFACWAPIPDKTSDDRTPYRKAREDVEGEIAARKCLRDFEQWQHLRGNAPKSSLDGARETMLHKGAGQTKTARRLRINVGEQLDAVGLIKRAGGDPEQFVPLSTLTLAEWVQEADRRAPQEMEQLRQAADKERRISRVKRNDLEWMKTFPFDSQVFFEERWGALFREGVAVRGDREQIQKEEKEEKEGLAWGERWVRPVLEQTKLGTPYPYIACLVADGDKMGASLDKLTTANEHQDFSRELSKFAAKARTIVEQDHRGSLVYAGGDDVLAFVCLSDALSCASQLKEAFERYMEKALPQKAQIEPPTLSVGIGIGHLLENMTDLLDWGRKAEKVAKAPELSGEGRDRNALAVVVEKRSGGSHSWRAQWQGGGRGPVATLERDVRLLATGNLPSKKIYEIRSTLRRFPSVEEASRDDGPGWAGALASDVRRSLARSGGATGEGTETSLQPQDVGLSLNEENYETLWREIEGWTSRLLIARVFAEATVTTASQQSAAEGGKQ